MHVTILSYSTFIFNALVFAEFFPSFYVLAKQMRDRSDCTVRTLHTWCSSTHCSHFRQLPGVRQSASHMYTSQNHPFPVNFLRCLWIIKLWYAGTCNNGVGGMGGSYGAFIYMCWHYYGIMLTDLFDRCAYRVTWDYAVFFWYIH